MHACLMALFAPPNPHFLFLLKTDFIYVAFSVVRVSDDSGVSKSTYPRLAGTMISGASVLDGFNDAGISNSKSKRRTKNNQKIDIKWGYASENVRTIIT